MRIKKKGLTESPYPANVVLTDTARPDPHLENPSRRFWLAVSIIASSSPASTAAFMASKTTLTSSEDQAFDRVCRYRVEVLQAEMVRYF